MSRFLMHRDSARYHQHISVLQVTIDPQSDRFFVLDRATLEVLVATKKTPTSVVKVRTPMKYANNFELIVFILDEDREFNMKALDGVKTETVLTPVDMSQ
ncbi:hypothetical protein [Shewanella chilikensis]|uniref:hypothetical protein n=1 Tax=Shewanella chilikensis TaxID=558541 RepID=UPI0039999311